MDELIGDIGRHLGVGQLVPRNGPGFEAEERCHDEIVRPFLWSLGMLERHEQSLLWWFRSERETASTTRSRTVIRASCDSRATLTTRGRKSASVPLVHPGEPRYRRAATDSPIVG
jgi:hypothetical protein